jgi:hypothetical protein
VTPEANKRLVRRVLNEIYGDGKLELADELIHPEFVDQAGAPQGSPSVLRASNRRCGACRAPLATSA